MQAPTSYRKEPTIVATFRIPDRLKYDGLGPVITGILRDYARIEAPARDCLPYRHEPKTKIGARIPKHLWKEAGAIALRRGETLTAVVIAGLEET